MKVKFIIQLGEALSLTKADIDFDKQTISVSKSYQRIGKKDIITPPKTPKSKRIIGIPDFLANDLKDYTDCLYGIQDDERIFQFTKYFLEHEMKRGIKKSGVKKYDYMI